MMRLIMNSQVHKILIVYKIDSMSHRIYMTHIASVVSLAWFDKYAMTHRLWAFIEIVVEN